MTNAGDEPKYKKVRELSSPPRDRRKTLPSLRKHPQKIRKPNDGRALERPDLCIEVVSPTGMTAGSAAALELMLPAGVVPAAAAAAGASAAGALAASVDQRRDRGFDPAMPQRLAHACGQLPVRAERGTPGC